MPDMAMLKDSLIAGDLRVTGTIYGDVPLNDLVDADDLKAIEALTGTSGLLKKTAANTWTLDTTAYKTGTVTSVRVQATSPVVSSVNTAQSSSLNTTISLADGYGDTKNPYASKTARYVLAAPASAAGAPSFRALTNADVGLGNVENTKLSTWAGSSNITTIGTLSSGTVPWARLSGVPSSMTPSSHAHGNITNDGKIGTTANQAAYTTTDGVVTAGTLPAAAGGTGKTTLKDAANALINALDTGSSNLTANDYVITQYVGGGTTTTTYHRRPASALRVGGLLTARTFTIGSTGKTFDGTGNVSWTLAEIGAAASNHNHDSTYVNVSGDTMTGALTLSGDPTSAKHAATKQYVDQSFAANDAMIFKGTIGSSGATVTALPDTHSIGWTYRVLTAGTYAGVKCEIGDLIICITDGTSANNAHWTVAQTNLDGAVIGPTSATSGNFVLFDGTSGKLIKNSSYSPSSFAAAGHTHTTSLTSGGTATINLAANTAYTLTAGGTSVVFKTPADNNTNYYHTTGSWSGLTYTATANGGAGALAFTIPTGTSATTVAVGNHTHDKSTITSVYEANLEWGGKNFSASYGPIDAAMIQPLGANRFAFLKPAGLTIEYSTDGGSTWTDYGATNTQKTGLFGMGQGFTLGKHTTAGTNTVNDQLRVTISTSEASLYTALNKIAIYMSTSGNTVQVKMEKALQSTPTSFSTHLDWTGISGWSGWNILNINSVTTYGNTAGSQYGKIRFTFKQTAVNTNYSSASISRIMGFGGQGWTVPSNMAADGHLYSYDNDQNAVFPAKVTATTLAGNLDWSYIQNKPTTLSGYGITNAPAWQITTKKSTELYDFGFYLSHNTAAGTGPSGGNYFSILNIPYRKATGNTQGDYGWQIGNTTDNDGRLFFRTIGNNVFGNWQEVAHAPRSTNNIGSATQPVYMTSTGVITAGTALKALAYKDSLTASDVGAATSGHTHPTTLATDTGTSSITLASAGKYKLTAGGNSVIFTMPTSNNYTHPTSAGNKHIPSGGEDSQILVYGGSSGTAKWETLYSDFIRYVEVPEGESFQKLTEITSWTTNTPTQVTKKTVVTNASVSNEILTITTGDSVTVTAGTAASLNYNNHRLWPNYCNYYYSIGEPELG